jgi:hypothetical protein
MLRPTWPQFGFLAELPDGNMVEMRCDKTFAITKCAALMAYWMACLMACLMASSRSLVIGRQRAGISQNMQGFRIEAH